MATLLKLDGTTEEIHPPGDCDYFEEEDMVDLLGGPVIAVSANDGHLLIMREYRLGQVLLPDNPLAARYFDVWPIMGPAVHLYYHEWYTDERNRFHFQKPLSKSVQATA